MIYLINFLCVPIYYFLITGLFKDKKRTRSLFWGVATIHAILFRALACPYVYVDTAGYAIAFQNIASMSFKEAVVLENFYTGWGRGYLAFNWLLAQISDNPTFLFVMLALVSVGGVMWYYKKTAGVPILAVMLYLYYPMMYTMGFGVVRQHLAIVFTLWAIYHADNLKIAAPLAIIGSLCHTGVVVVLPYLIFKNINLKKLSLLKWIALTVSGFVILRYLVPMVVSVDARYENIYTSGIGRNNIVPVVMIGSMLLLCWTLGVFRRVQDPHDRHVLRFLIYGLIIALFSMGVPEAGRLTLPCIYILPVAICFPFKYIKRDERGIAYMYVIAVFILVTYLVYMSGAKYEEYKFFWEC